MRLTFPPGQLEQFLESALSIDPAGEFSFSDSTFMAVTIAALKRSSRWNEEQFYKGSPFFPPSLHSSPKSITTLE